MLINSPSCPRELEMRSRGRDLCHEEGERLDQHLLPLDDRGLGEDDLESGEVEEPRGVVGTENSVYLQGLTQPVSS